MRMTVLTETLIRSEEVGNDPVWSPAMAPPPYNSRSLLVWGEHCTDCANPLCYMTCALYAPRYDLKCRRFTDGLEQVRPMRGRKGGRWLLRAQFGKWGKLEASGSAALVGPRQVKIIEWFDHWVSRFIDSRWLPYEFRRIGGKGWNIVKPKILAHFGKLSRPSGFLIEAVNHESHEISFILSILNEEHVGRKFDASIRLTPGYNRTYVDRSDFEAIVPAGKHMRAMIEPVGDVYPTVSFLTIDFIGPAKLPPDLAISSLAKVNVEGEKVVESETTNRRPKIKCVVWDLDNTIWNGTLVEDGPEAIKLNPVAVAAIIELDRRGIIQSVASKNNQYAAELLLRKFGLSNYFLFPQINWNPKSVNVATIRQSLNIGIDTFLFVDDQPFERGEVLTACPDVEAFDPANLESLLAHPRLNVAITSESQNRRKMYVEEQERTAALTNNGTHYIDFLRQCDIRLRIGDLNETNLDRVCELTERTNQLNYSGNRITRQALKNLMNVGGTSRGLVLSVIDKFGDYGIIGFAVITTAEWRVTDFFMSCRVQRKKVDHCFFNWLRECGAKSGREKLIIDYRETARNSASREVLEQEMRLARLETEAGLVCYLVPTDQAIIESDIVMLVDSSSLSRKK
jgi:FkbH-like protein